MSPGLWPADDMERVLRALVDYSRQAPEAAVSPRKGSTLPPKERAVRNARNKAARQARRQNRSK